MNFFPEFPDGENEETSKEYKSRLILEFKKKQDYNLIEKWMYITYSLRRKEILTCPKSVVDMQKDWPFLFQPKQVSFILVLATKRFLVPIYYLHATD